MVAEVTAMGAVPMQGGAGNTGGGDSGAAGGTGGPNGGAGNGPGGNKGANGSPKPNGKTQVAKDKQQAAKTPPPFQSKASSNSGGKPKPAAPKQPEVFKGPKPKVNTTGLPNDVKSKIEDRSSPGHGHFRDQGETQQPGRSQKSGSGHGERQ